ncbi:MAG: hypothetical protein JNJ59_13620 [Deltaproteobacteria bacterium]|nr:hypothetical protein [Deltaproteobacteria bacterium]
MPTVFRHLRSSMTSLATLVGLGLAWGADAQASDRTDGQRLLGVCQTLLGESSSFCDVVTQFSIEKTVDVPLAEQPNRRAIAYTIRLIEGQSRYVLGMTSIVTLQGLVPEGTEVRGIVVSLQRADAPNPDAIPPKEPAYTTVAGALVGNADPACGCPYVSPTQGGSLDVTLRDQLGNELPVGAGNVIDNLDYARRVTVQLDAVYDLSAGVVLPGDLVRIQACVQYAPIDESGVSGCFDAGGAVRSVRACSSFDFEDYAKPKTSTVTLEELLGVASQPWIIQNGFRAKSTSAQVTPTQVVVPVIPGGNPAIFNVQATGNPGTESVISVKGDLSCGDVVDCGEDRLCTGTVTNTATLDFGDARDRVSSTALTQVVCGAHLCTPSEVAGCDDDDPCTTDTCEVGVGCVHAPYTGACDDGDACTTGERCLTGVCTGGGPTACQDDGNPCTDEACLPDRGCVRTNRPNRTRCEDGNACTVDDICMEGTCVGGATVSCNDNNPCTTDTCTANGGCAHTPIAGGPGSCDDGDPCTVGDFCGSGSCNAGPALTCKSDGNACTSDTCVSGQGCVYPALADTTACSDGNACTTGDRCQAGVCRPGAAPDCNDNNPCTNDGCDTELGCYHAPRTGACDDGSACTSASTCVDGQCRGTVYLDCDDANPCTVDSCDPQTGCKNVTIANNTPCDDGDACSTGETCQSGTCLAQTLVTCDDQNPCTTETCLPEQGCVSFPKSGACEDGNQCTGPDTCQASACLSGPALNCNDNNPCTQDSCDPATGCKHTPLSVGSCDDGDLCTGNGTCSAGQCLRGQPISCEDGNPCTDGVCDPAQGCVQMQRSGACDDGDPCTGNGTCSQGTCQPGPAIVCNDGLACTADYCKPGVGCATLPRSDVPCDDGNPCTLNDLCQAGVCVGGAALSCNDNNPCTADSCGPNGCVNTPTAGPCEDGNLCTVGDHCSGGQCIKGDPKVCDDANTCTTDACNPSTGSCTYAPRSNGSLCDDGNACTGCPWAETPVSRGYFAMDAVPDLTWFTSTTPTAVLELDQFLGPGTGKAYFKARPDLRWIVLPSGAGIFRGTIRVPIGGTQRVDTEDWTIDLAVSFRGLGRAGQGATPFYELPSGTQGTYYTDNWEYWSVGSGSLVRSSPSADSATLVADPNLSSLPLQIGIRANGRGPGYGGSLPVRWTRGTRYGTGVLRFELDREYCLAADTCTSGTCGGGTSRSECSTITVGNYCTYPDFDYAATCSAGAPTSAACILNNAFTLIAQERTACSTSIRGVAFGMTGYRRWGFTTAGKVQAFLPTTGGGSSAVDLCNPASSTAAAFVGRVFALDLSIILSDVGALPAPNGVPLGELVRTTGPCAGLTIREIARRGEAVASGAPTGATTCSTQTILDAEVNAITQGFYRCQSVMSGVALPQ